MPTPLPEAPAAHADATPVAIPGRGTAADYAAHLLRSLGTTIARTDGPRDPHPAIDWARSGAMHLTGYADGPPRLAPGPLGSCARGAVSALDALAPGAEPLDGPALLGEHAAAFGYHRHGRIAPGRHCRLLRAADGWIALNLARPDDVACLPAWLGDGAFDDPWELAAARLADRTAAEMVARGRLIGLPVAVAAAPAAEAPPWLRVAAEGPPRRRADAGAPLVADLTSLWAGPLCGRLLARAGARVVKVESAKRPDGARSGTAAFFDLLNGDKASVALDFADDVGRERLRALLERADVVLESARPRALRQLGIDAEALVAESPGKVWVSITGYGRSEPEANWVAFGDDAAAAAGLAWATGDPDAPIFCGDAIADPLTGLHAAVSALATWRARRGALLDVSLCAVAAHAAAFPHEAAEAAVHCADAAADVWEVTADAERAAVATPRLRPARAAARALGADNEAVFAELGIRC